MWKGIKEIPENYHFDVVNAYKIGKRLAEYTHSDGECIGYVTAGRFELFLDIVGNASFWYQGILYGGLKDVTGDVMELIREDSPEIDWVVRPKLSLYLVVGNSTYAQHTETWMLTTLPNTLFLEAHMCHKLASLVDRAERENWKSDNGSNGLPSSLTAEEEAFLAILSNSQEETVRFQALFNQYKGKSDLGNRLMNEEGLMNVLEMFDVTFLYDANQDDWETTIAWSSPHLNVNAAMRAIFKEWEALARKGRFVF